ncbi:MAG TPA: hypothetical protein VK589_21095 [Chryseolinea sp.]|nr:hypothetical protein [Chryseolinea sp.]
MKLNFLKYRTNMLLRNNKTPRTNVPYKKAHQIGIIFSVEDKVKHDNVKDLIKKFEQDGKQVTVIEFLPENKDNYEFKFDFFTEKDLSFWGNITSSGALKFADTSFDFLYYLDATPNPLILHLLALSKAKCRVGKSWDDGTSYFEFMVESVGNIKAMIETMYKYTALLK